MGGVVRDGRVVRSESSGLVTVLAFAGIVVSLSQTLVIPLLGMLPEIADATPSHAACVRTSTRLTAAVAVPVLGGLGDLYPKKYVMLGAVGVMVLGSVMCALASSLWPMVIGRGLQGFGIGFIPVGIATMRALLPPARLGSAIALMSSPLGVGGALGSPAAAAPAQYGDWRWMFWGCAVLGLALILLIALRLDAVPPAKPDGTLDVIGALGLAVGLVSLLLAISKGADGGWVSGLTVGLFVLAVVAFGVGGWWVRRGPSPVVDHREDARPTWLIGNVATLM